MDLWCTTTFTEYQTDDWQSTIIIFSILLADHWAITFVRKLSEGKSPGRSVFFKFVFLILQSLWIFSLINYEPPTYDNGDYQYPAWAHGIGWSFAAASLVCIPVFAVIAIIRGEGNTFSEVCV